MTSCLTFFFFTCSSVPRVEDMTLDEKLGQMALVDQLALINSRGQGDDIANYFIGSVFR